MSIVIHGRVAPGFEDLADVYGRLAASQTDHASGLVVHHRGEVVVDLRAGDYPSGARQLLFSVSKLVVALALFRARAAGLVDLDAPIARSWPALARGEAPELTLRDVLAHRSGLFRLEQPIALDVLMDGGDRTAVEFQSPDSGSGHAYHAFTFGTLVTGALATMGAPSPAELIERFLAAPLAIDLRLGLPRSVAPDVHPVRFSAPAVIVDEVSARRDLPVDQALVTLLADPEVFNTDAFLASESAAMGVVATARALSVLMAACLEPVEGVRLLSEAELDEIRVVQSSGVDGALGVTSRFGTGVQLAFPRAPWTSEAAFGHEGAGGCAAFADPDLRLAVGFTTDGFPAAPGASPVLLGLLAPLAHLARRRADTA